MPLGKHTPVEIVDAHQGAALDEVGDLFRRYAGALGIDLSFQDFEEELAGLPGAYEPPGGALLLARIKEQAAGCVAMRPFQDEICEMKRLYILPRYRGRGLGRVLARAVIERACQAGYRRMRLDTLPSMSEALSLYRSLGFRHIGPYRYNPVKGTAFMERVLA